MNPAGTKKSLLQIVLRNANIWPTWVVHEDCVMAKVKMKEVPIMALRGRSIIDQSFVGAAVKGGGNIDYVCCGCDQVLFENVNYKQVMHITVKCGKCGKYNEIPLAHETH